MFSLQIAIPSEFWAKQGFVGKIGGEQEFGFFPHPIVYM